MSVPQVGPWSIKVISCQHVMATKEEPNLFVLMGMLHHGSHSNQDGALLYLAESSCGSLPCPPYGNAKELTCAVCTK
jgi:hypothetical protein